MRVMAIDTPSRLPDQRARVLPLWIMVGLLLLVFISRLPLLHGLEMDTDEVWSVWQTLGTAEDIVRWTPYDWMPTYFLSMGAWRTLVGLEPLALRLSTLFVFLIGTACVYRAARGDRWESFGLLAAVFYAALGYSVFTSVYTRGSGLTMAFLPILLWMALRYFRRPTVAMGIALGVGLAALFWLYLNAPFAIVMLGLFTLCLYPRRIWRWWLPGLVLAVLSAPVIVLRLDLALNRTGSTSSVVLPPLPEALAELYRTFFGQGAVIWAVLLGVATLASLLHLRDRQRRGWWLGLLLWAFAAPVAMYILNPWLGFFPAHYSWWIPLAIALWIAFGIAALPRPAVVLAGAVGVGLMFAPVDQSWYGIRMPPVSAGFRWLSERYQPGDVLIVDPACRCPEPDVWDYQRMVRFPSGLSETDAPAETRRVWYLATDGFQTQPLYADIQNGRLAGEFFGPWDYLLRLYEGPPDSAGIRFENGMIFHGADIVSNHGGQLESGIIVRHEGEPLHVRLWWSSDGIIDRDYSVGLYLMQDGQVVAQVDGPPAIRDAPSATSAWAPGTLGVEVRTLSVPYPAASGTLDLVLKVYHFSDGVPVSAGSATDADGLLPIHPVRIRAW
jgi:hypothetical protein